MSGLSFLHPGLLLGLGTLVIPIVIHLINRRRAYLHQFAAIEFLLRTPRRFAAKWQLKQIILLIVRCMTLALLCIALARPVLSTLGVAVSSHDPTSLVVILDTSYSMQYQLHGEPLFDRARAVATNLLRSLHRTDNAALFFGGQPSATSTAGLTFDIEPLLRDLATHGPTFGVTNVPAWIKAACSVLRESRLAHRRMCVLTDAARHGWPPQSAETLASLIKSAGIQCDVLDVSAGLKPENLAITALTLLQSRSDTPLVSAKIANYSERNISGLTCHLLVDGKEQSTGFIDLPPWGVSTKEFSCGTFSPGYHVAQVKLDTASVNDHLPVDDCRWLSLTAERPLYILLVDGAPGPHIYASETFYLERALAPDASDRGLIRVTVMTDAQLASIDLGKFDCIFLCNVATFDVGKIREFASFVEKGGGLFISVGDNVDSGYYNRALSALLPATLHEKKDFASQTTAQVTLKFSAENTHPLAQEMQSLGVDLSRCTVKKAIILDPRSAHIILRFSNDTPALVEHSLGQGRVMLLATTVDRDWTDLPIAPTFLPLMQVTARYLAGRISKTVTLDTVVRRPVELTVPLDCKRVRITNPAGAAKEFELTGWRLPRLMKFFDTGTPGLYEIVFMGMPPGQERTGFVVNLEADSESNLQKISPKDVACFGARLVHVTQPPLAVTMNYLVSGVVQGLWGPLLVGVLFLLTVECLLGRKP